MDEFYLSIYFNEIIFSSLTERMDFRNARARQPEIVRSVQKDAKYSSELSEDLSDILRLTGPRNWIKYNSLTKLLAEISYHGFASLNNLQTLGEEYTGIIQVDSVYKQIPSRLVSKTLSCELLFFNKLYLCHSYNSQQ